MFFRQKRSGDHVYLQIVENRRENGGSKQRVIATVERLDQLQESGQLDGLLQSGAKFSESVMVLAAHRQGVAGTTEARRQVVGGQQGIPQVSSRRGAEVHDREEKIKWDETIRGHVFCSFLALLLRKELQFRSQTEKHELSHLYEAKIKNMGNAGEYY